ncbi:hypothetical protein E2562_032349 [Oryza meyeriana var. granulata]|uniref:Uncharacterized protein n=1 Tax=Oryza meyeriana var. granulata TaxID=110450 RepID=A0A6G1CAM9_9ORYZ|nr:hypothetical protein E2562_032349 [Oryza meyeriana var. granulata]
MVKGLIRCRFPWNERGSVEEVEGTESTWFERENGSRGADFALEVEVGADLMSARVERAIRLGQGGHDEGGMGHGMCELDCTELARIRGEGREASGLC